jgi:hypothetical protein
LFIVFISSNKTIWQVYLRVSYVQNKILLWDPNLILLVSQANLGSGLIQRAVLDLMIFTLNQTYLSLHLDRNVDIPKYLIVGRVRDLIDFSHFYMYLFLFLYLQRTNKG